MMKSVTWVVTICLLNCLGVRPAAAAAPSDVAQPGATWDAEGGNGWFTILERKGEWFRGHYERDGGKIIREMTGAVKDDFIFWRHEDQRVLAGHGSGDWYCKFDGDKLYVNTYNGDGTAKYTMTLRRPGGSPAGSPAPAGPPPTPWIAVFAREEGKAAGWATLPLANKVPGTIRDQVADLQTGLKDEAAKTPQASAQAYAYADQICRSIIYALDDREGTLQQNRQNAAGKLTDTWINDWAGRATRYRNTLRTNFALFGEAVRQSAQPKVPPPAGLVASISLPGVPADAAAPTNDFKPDPKNPLNKGAYDRHSAIWAPWWGYYRY